MKRHPPASCYHNGGESLQVSMVVGQIFRLLTFVFYFLP
jgi:hypothetical protein